MIKRIIDIIFSSIIILLFLPIGIIIALILLLSGEGEVIYKQPRIGRYGKNFKMLKFVTMVKNSPNIGSGDITLKNDPRVLPFGKLLRKTKLNEFPQFINVFIGDMSIVGPRPLVKNQFDMIPEDLKTIIKKLKPGITGIGSIIFRDEEKYLTKNNNASNFYANEIVPFKKGVGRIYEALNIACVPVALNSGKVWPKNSFIKYPGKITVSFLEPIKPGLNRDEFIKNLEIKIYEEIKNIS